MDIIAEQGRGGLEGAGTVEAKEKYDDGKVIGSTCKGSSRIVSTIIARCPQEQQSGSLVSAST